jgi:hypothetical protein
VYSRSIQTLDGFDWKSPGTTGSLCKSRLRRTPDSLPEISSSRLEFVLFIQNH